MKAMVLAASLLALGPGAPAAKAAPQTAPRVGVPGCADDVAVQASRELISFESRGRPIRAYLYRPRGPENGDGVVMLHGGTGFEMNAILFDAHAIQLASRGYWVLLPAYFDAAQPDPGRPNVTGRAWRQVALDAAATLADRSGAPVERVALWGYSRGAFVAVDAAVMEGSPVRSAILAAGAGSVEERVEGRDLAVLLLHARHDEAVPANATRRLAEDLREAGATVEVERLDFGGHQYDLPTWCAVMGRTRTFLEARRTSSDT